MNGCEDQEQTMNTAEKGNKLEDDFYDYLFAQQDSGLLVYDAYPPELCKIYKKKKYHCTERNGDVEFDVVIEMHLQGRSEPHLYVVFECKNHRGAIQERDVTDFTDKIGRIFGYAVKGIVVVSSRLQSGAENIARSRNIGIVKFDKNGLEVVADRTGRTYAESRFVETQIFETENRTKSLKFSAYYDGNFFGSIDHLLRGFDPSQSIDDQYENGKTGKSVPFISYEEIRRAAEDLLAKIQYHGGPIDLAEICSMLSLDLTFSEQVVQDSDGNLILGSANFDRKSIQINSHENKQRERFTIGHEIGHFCLLHGRYLRSESIVEQDLLINTETDNDLNYQRLEYQANTFASDLVLPDQHFRIKTAEYRQHLGVKDRGHGYIFVDDQPCNYGPYIQLLLDLTSYFNVSR